MKQLIIIFLLLITFTSCNKYIDVKSNSALALPDNLASLQGMLTSTFSINTVGIGSSTTSCDEFYVTPDIFKIGSVTEQSLYTWEHNNPDNNSAEWMGVYGFVYIANAILENIDKITLQPSEIVAAHETKGGALFLRARANFQLATAFAKGYDISTASNEPGIPLRLTTDFNQKDVRSSLEATYQQIISDLKAAIPLLLKSPVNEFHACKAAAYGLLARTYLSMRDYSNCQLYADSSLQEKSVLLDYNTVVNSPTPFPQDQTPEVIYGSTYNGSVYLYDPYGLIDSSLIRLYDNNDLRKKIYFSDHGDGTYSFSFSGYYSGLVFFDGIATDEMYLMRSECLARNGDITSAMNDLNTLLKNRYSNAVPYVNRTASGKEDAVSQILQERRKELVFRGLRWMDLKRLNLEGANITLKRVLGDKEYRLAPNSPRYAIPFPDDIIKLSGMPQNQY